MSTTTNRSVFFLRQAFRNREDLLKLRISAGNRLVAVFRERFLQNEDLSAEVTADESKKEMDKDKALQVILKSYPKITEFIASKLVTDLKKSAIKKKNKKLSKEDEEKAEAKAQEKVQKALAKGLKVTSTNFDLPEDEVIIREFKEFLLLDNYINLVKAEQVQCANMEAMLDGIPIYDNYLKHIKGIGGILSSFLIAEIDIYKCTYPSNLHSFFGLAPSNGMACVKPNWNKVNAEGKRIGVLSFYINNDHGKNVFIGKIKDWDFLGLKHDKIDKYESPDKIVIQEDIEKPDNYRVFVNFSEGVYDTNISFDKEMIDIDGSKARERFGKAKPKPKAKKVRKLGLNLGEENAVVEEELEQLFEGDVITAVRSLGFSVARQGKLKGALVMPLICHNEMYRTIRNDYKERLSQMPQHQGESLQRIQATANTLMLKIFLTNLYRAWRALEGLPVADDYATAKLGLVHGSGNNNLNDPDRKLGFELE